MKRRFCSQFIYCPPGDMLRQAVVEQEGESGVVADLFLLGRARPESAHTLFVDGILSGEIRSLKLSLPPEQLPDIRRRYHYIDLSAGIPVLAEPSGHKPLLLDFGTDCLSDINRMLCGCTPFLSRYPLIEVLSACVYRPALELGCDWRLAVGHSVRLHQWKGTDLVRQRVTERTKVKLL